MFGSLKSGREAVYPACIFQVSCLKFLEHSKYMKNYFLTPHCRLTTPPRRTLASICMHVCLIFLETTISLHFATDSMSKLQVWGILMYRQFTFPATVSIMQRNRPAAGHRGLQGQMPTKICSLHFLPNKIMKEHFHQFSILGVVLVLSAPIRLRIVQAYSICIVCRGSSSSSI